jgi:hypothetical protein
MNYKSKKEFNNLIHYNEFNIKERKVNKKTIDST